MNRDVRWKAVSKLRLINPKNSLNGLVDSRIARRVTFGRKAVFMPLGLMVTAGVVPSTWKVEICDECTGPLPDSAAGVDLVGITAMTCQAPRAYEIADRYLQQKVPVILGGIHPSALPEEALAHATAVSVGEAESTLPRMLADFEASRLGGIYRAEGTVAIGRPRRDLLNPKDYFVWNAVQTSRGCPHRCRFCTTQAMYGGRFAWRPVEEICQEIRELGAKRVVFSDDNIFGNHAWSRQLFTELEKMGVGWCGQTSIDIARDEATLDLVKRSGCMGLILGLESPRQECLAEGNKTYCDPADYEPLIRRIKQRRIGVWGSLLFGFDCDTVESCHDSVRFARRVKLDISCYPILTPYPGTPLFEQYAGEGRLLTRDWSKYNGATAVFQPKLMSPRELANCQVAAFREFYSWGSMWERLRILDFQKWAWIINIAIHGGFSYYFRSRKKTPPDFRQADRWRETQA